MRLKDGHTYITRSGVKRKVTLAAPGDPFPYETASIFGDGFTEKFTETGRFIDGRYKHRWDLVKEFKSNAK